MKISNPLGAGVIYLRLVGDVQVAISPRAHGTSPGALLGKRGDANTWLVIIVLK